jgi:hypothetical protein
MVTSYSNWQLDLRTLASRTPPPFDRKKIYTMEPWNYQLFYEDSEFDNIEGANVNLESMVGHAQAYGEMDWNKMLFGLKRTEKSLKLLKNNPEYFLSDSYKSGWSFIEIDGSLFVSQGKHRTGILRYLAHFNPSQFPDGPIARGVYLTRRFVDHATMDNLFFINQLLRTPEFSHLTLKYVSYNDDKKEFRLINKKADRYSMDRMRSLCRAELPELANELKASTRLKRWLEPGIQRHFRKSSLPWRM